MRKPLPIAVGIVLLAALAAGAAKHNRPDQAFQANAEGQMLFPDHYRDWVWLSSGLGMSYTTGPENDHPSFQNVFVSPAAYQTFQATGTWPNGTVFVLEIRASSSRGSINQNGRYQADIMAIETHVKKDNGEWAFYGFGNGRKPAAMLPKTTNCYSCHEQHGAVDTTFVQFYPTLIPIAREKKTYKESE